MGLNIMKIIVQPIFHCNAKPFALGTGIGLATLLRYLTQKIPICWYLLRRVTQI